MQDALGDGLPQLTQRAQNLTFKQNDRQQRHRHQQAAKGEGDPIRPRAGLRYDIVQEDRQGTDVGRKGLALQVQERERGARPPPGMAMATAREWPAGSPVLPP